MNGISEKIKELISQSFEATVPIDDISDQDDLFQFGMDSISAIKLIVAIESEFGFDFDDEDLDMNNVKTISKISEYILDKINHK